MKKRTLYFSVIFLYLAYIVYQKTSFAATPVVLPPKLSQSIPVINSSPVVATTTPPPAAQPASAPAPAQTAKPSAPKSAPPAAPAPAPKPKGLYADGQYNGSVADAYYGNVQVAVTVSGGKISNVQFLDYPHDRSTSREINSQAMPYLIQEALQAQNANVDVISGATFTSQAFVESLASALAKAKNS